MTSKEAWELLNTLPPVCATFAHDIPGEQALRLHAHGLIEAYCLYMPTDEEPFPLMRCRRTTYGDEIIKDPFQLTWDESKMSEPVVPNVDSPLYLAGFHKRVLPYMRLHDIGLPIYYSTIEELYEIDDTPPCHEPIQ